MSSNRFWISDLHFDHANVLKYNNRPWLQDGDILPDGQWASHEIRNLRVEEMNQGLVDNWNGVVNKRDFVYIIGDFAFNNHAKWFHALKGKKILIRGSHDKMNQETYNLFYEVCNRKVLKVNGRAIDMNHCCQRVWEQSHYGSIHLFGHSHSRLNTFNLSFDVGVDVPGNNYSPINEEEIFIRVKVREEEMRQAGRIVTDKKTGKTTYYQDDLAFFTPKARNSQRNTR